VFRVLELELGYRRGVWVGRGWGVCVMVSVKIQSFKYDYLKNQIHTLPCPEFVVNHIKGW